MGIDYLVCTVCEEAFPDVIDYGWCGNCEESMCESCKGDMIDKYGQVDEDSEFVEDYGDGNPAKCDSCENPTVTITQEEYGRLKAEKGETTIELKHNEMGSLKQIADVIWDEMLKEIERNGYSDLTLAMEGSVHGIREIIEINGIDEKTGGERIIEAINESCR